MSKANISGIHHVTALASGTQLNIDIYAGILGLRLVKRTVNFDAPDVHHLYYGDGTGAPGSIMTFFPYEGLARGRTGRGQLTTTSFSIPPGSITFWQERLERFKVEHSGPRERFGNEVFISFEDNDGLQLELVAHGDDDRPGNPFGPIPQEHSIRGFFGVTLSVDGYERTGGLLTEHMDHDLIKESSDRFRFAPRGGQGQFVDVVCSPHAMRGIGGSGTIHHVAFATADDDTQLEMREKLLANGLQVTPVMDRQYFRSIYFREPGGVLFEIATVPPGFGLDESLEHLGTELRLPPWLERDRERIAKGLGKIEVNTDKFR